MSPDAWEHTDFLCSVQLTEVHGRMGWCIIRSGDDEKRKSITAGYSKDGPGGRNINEVKLANPI